MKSNLRENSKIHVHCFTSSTELVEKLLSNFSNLYVGFTGISTFKTGYSFFFIYFFFLFFNFKKKKPKMSENQWK